MPTRPIKRLFYNEIDVVGNQGNNTSYLSIGTGKRSHRKIKNASNFHYRIKDALHKSLTSTAGAVFRFGLAQWPTDSDYDWLVVPLSLGEKVLARSSTISQQIIFTAFTPKDPTLSSEVAMPISEQERSISSAHLERHVTL